MRNFTAWLKLFRVTNLPTVPGDALAGAALAMFLVPDLSSVKIAIFSSVSLLFLYMYGLADNDVAGAKTDVGRPVPSGEISLRSARIASYVCIIAALAIAVAFSFPPAWYAVFAVLAVLIPVYNRSKIPFLMGLCRGLGVVSGMCAVIKTLPCAMETVAPPAMAVFGWTLYIAGVTKLSEGEDSDSSGLGFKRFLWGLPSLLPALGAFFAPRPDEFILPVAGCLFTYVSWCFIVAPLGEAHSSQERMQAVGKTIGALLYMQIGFMFIGRLMPLIAASCVLWLTARFIRKSLPSISGS